MSEKFRLKGCIYEVNFGSNVKMKGYTSSGSDIATLCEIDCAYMRNFIHQIIPLLKSSDINAYSGVELLW